LTVATAGYNVDYNLRRGEGMHRTIKIRRVGRSLGAIFPKELLEELSVGEGDELVVTRSDTGINLSVGDPVREDTLSVFERGRRQYRETLRRLSE
jgi:putative addiction module antidote